MTCSKAATFMKWLNGQDVRLTIPLIVLFAIGIAGFWAPNYIPAIALVAREGVNQEWLGFIGNIVGATVTLIAAGIAWFAVRRQITAQTIAAEQIRARKAFAARGILPMSLSALYHYAEQCIAALDALPDPVAPATMFHVPTLPLQDVQEIRAALEDMEPEAAQQLVETLQFLQIQHARIRALERNAFDGALIAHEIQRRLIDAADLVALINRSFIHARGTKFVAPTATAEELESALLMHNVNDGQFWIQTELKRRRDAESDRDLND